MIYTQNQESVQATDDRPRLNPLALPAETDGLFRMMVVGSFLLAMYTVFIYLVLASLLGLPVLYADAYWNTLTFEQMTQTIGDRWIFALGDPEVRALADALVGPNLNAFVSSLPRLAVVSLFGLVLIVAATIVYRGSLARMIRRGKLRPLSAFPRQDLAAKILMTIDEIARQAGLKQTPEIVIRTSRAGDAQVFGRRGRYMLRIDAIPLTRAIDEVGDLSRRCTSETFRARVLHEFGHIVNHDVEQGYFSLSIWRIFITLILSPLIILSVTYNTIINLQAAQQIVFASPEWWAGMGTFIFRQCILLAQTAALILVMRALWRALLRTREYYADWRAALWGAETPIRQLLSQSSLPQDGAADAAQTTTIASIVKSLKSLASWARERWKSIWRFHTSPATRLDRLNDPYILFKISPDISFLTGVLFSFTMSASPMLLMFIALPLFNLSEALSWFVAGLAIDLAPPLNRALYIVTLFFRVSFQVTFLVLALLVFAYLVVGSLGRQVQRDSLSDLLPDRHSNWGYVGLLKPALLLAVGLEFGLLITPANTLSPHDLLSLVLIPVWFSAFALLSWFWLVYVRLLARWILGSHVGPKLPAWKRRLVTGFSLFALWTLYLPMLLARLTIVLVSIQPAMRERIMGTPFADERFFGLTYGYSIFVLLTLGTALFFLWVVLTAGGTGLLLSLRRRRCPRCGEVVRGWTIVGSHCSACYQPLAMWLFVQPDQERY